jgi:LPXTG-site transpeptidase (sortase) family protein
MTDTLDDHSHLPPPPGLFDLGTVEEEYAASEFAEDEGDFAEVKVPKRRGRRRQKRDPSLPVPPLSPRAKLAQGVLVLVFVLSAAFVVELLIISGIQQRAAQQVLFDDFRRELAEGTAPIGPNQPQAQSSSSATAGVVPGQAPAEPEEPEPEVLLAPGSPVAYLEIPAIGLRQVVVEGTAGSQLFDGPGHRRDSPLPGQEGTTIIMGRKAAFGGPFGEIDQLAAGDQIKAVTGQGEFVYTVIGVREEGDPVPEPAEAGTARMLLVTADGPAFFPDGVLRVDAELDGEALGAPARPFTVDTLPAGEAVMASDTATLFALVLWMQALVLLLVGAVWAWQRMGKAKAWVIFLPPLVLVSLFVAGEAARLLPNLL